MSTGVVQGSGDGVIATAADLAVTGASRAVCPLSSTFFEESKNREHDGAVEFAVVTLQAVYSRVAGDQLRAPRPTECRRCSAMSTRRSRWTPMRSCSRTTRAALL